MSFKGLKEQINDKQNELYKESVSRVFGKGSYELNQITGLI